MERAVTNQMQEIKNGGFEMVEGFTGTDPSPEENRTGSLVLTNVSQIAERAEKEQSSRLLDLQIVNEKTKTIYQLLMVDPAILSLAEKMEEFRKYCIWNEAPDESSILHILKSATECKQEIPRFEIEFNQSPSGFRFISKEESRVVFDSNHPSIISCFLVANRKSKFSFKDEKFSKPFHFFKKDFNKKNGPNCGTSLLCQEYKVLKERFGVITTAFTLFPFDEENPILILTSNRMLAPSTGARKRNNDSETQMVIKMEREKRRKGVHRMILSKLEVGKEKMRVCFEIIHFHREEGDYDTPTLPLPALLSDLSEKFSRIKIGRKRTEQIPEDEMKRLIEYFFHSETLDMLWGDVAPEDVRFLLGLDKYLCFNTDKRHFIMDNGGQPVESMNTEYFSRNLNSTLESMCFEYAIIGEKGMVRLSEWIPTSSLKFLKINYLCLAKDAAFTEGMIKLLQAVKVNRTITKLELGHMKENAVSLILDLCGNLLQENSTIRKIRLCFEEINYNQSKREAIKKFVDQLINSSAISADLKIVLSGRKVFIDEGAKGEFDRLFHSNKLKKIAIVDETSRSIIYSAEIIKS